MTGFPMGPNYGPPPPPRSGPAPPNRFGRPSPLPPPSYNRGARQGTVASSPPHPGLPPAVNQTLQNIGRYLVGGRPPSSNFDAVSQFTPEQTEQRLLADVQANMQYALPPPMDFGVTSPQSSTVLNPNVVPQHVQTTQEILRQNELRRQNELMQRGLPPGGPPPPGPPPTRYTPRR
jgi:hypothetical protein